MDIGNVLNTIHQKIPHYFALENYVKDTGIQYVDEKTNTHYVIIATTNNDYSEALQKNIEHLHNKGFVTAILPLGQEIPTDLVKNWDRYKGGINYQNVKEDFGTIDFSNFYADVAPILYQTGIPLHGKTKINSFVNSAGELELITLEEGKDKEGPRSDLFTVQDLLKKKKEKIAYLQNLPRQKLTREEKNNLQALKFKQWTFYTPKEANASQQAIIAPVNNKYLCNHFTQHTQQEE